MSDPVPSTEKWWLGLQVGLGLGGGTLWLAGKIVESEFTAGTGLGLVVAALVLRFGRRAAEEGP